MGKNFLLSEATAKKLDALLAGGSFVFSPQDFRVVERADGKHVFVVDKQTVNHGRTTSVPFWPVVRPVGDPATYEISVAWGKVVERKLSAGEGENSLIHHEPSNILTDGFPTWFSIASGEALFVKVLENAGGTVDGASVELVVADAAQESRSYIPTIQDGEYYYKICDFTVVGGIPEIEKFAAGSHIYIETGLTCDVRLLACPVYPYETPPAQLLRMSFVSGRIVSTGASVEDRPLSDVDHNTNVDYCT